MKEEISIWIEAAADTQNLSDTDIRLYYQECKPAE